MAVRVKIKIKVKNSDAEAITNALVNTGFETEKPELLIPVKLATELGLWPPGPDASIIELGTAGGPIRNFVIFDALEVGIITTDRKMELLPCSAIISSIEEEVLINDKLAGIMKIVLIDIGEGHWRFRDDADDTIRKSELLQLW